MTELPEEIPKIDLQFTGKFQDAAVYLHNLVGLLYGIGVLSLEDVQVLCIYTPGLTIR